MNWKVVFIPEAEKDFSTLDSSAKRLVQKALMKVSTNPLPDYEGGYGKPLGNHAKTKLAGLLKIKLKTSGIRVVYKLIRTDTQMLIVVIGARADDEVYETAQKRISGKALDFLTN